MSTQRRLCDWGGSKTSRDELVHELRRLHHHFDGVDAETIRDRSRFQASQFVDEFGCVVRGLEAADVVADTGSVYIPTWARERYYALEIADLRVPADADVYELPEWLDDYDQPIVRPTASSRKGMHAPAVDEDEPTPRCEARHRDGGRYTVSEREAVEGWYHECGNRGCQEWFDAAPRGLPGSSDCVTDMTNGGGN